MATTHAATQRMSTLVLVLGLAAGAVADDAACACADLQAQLRNQEGRMQHQESLLQELLVWKQGQEQRKVVEPATTEVSVDASGIVGAARGRRLSETAGMSMAVPGHSHTHFFPDAASATGGCLDGVDTTRPKQVGSSRAPNADPASAPHPLPVPTVLPRGGSCCRSRLMAPRPSRPRPPTCPRTPPCRSCRLRRPGL